MKYPKTNLHKGLMARVQRKSDSVFQKKINEASKNLMKKVEARKISLENTPQKRITRFLKGKRKGR